MKYYKVAHHTFGIDITQEDEFQNHLPSFQPFLCNSIPAESRLLFTLTCRREEECSQEEPLTLLDENGNDMGHWRLYETATGYRMDLSYQSNIFHTMICSRDFRTCRVALKQDDPFRWAALNSFLMMAFSQSSTAFGTTAIHASVVMKDDKGYAFLGKSGTGKSTHSQLWLKHISGTELLNDDNPAIRIMENGEIHIFGTPWSGKTDCYKNKEVKLAGIVQLKQAPYNAIKPLKGVQAYMALLKSCSSLKWNQKLYTSLGNTIETIANTTPLFYLENLPNEEAALLSYGTLTSGTTSPRI